MKIANKDIYIERERECDRDNLIIDKMKCQNDPYVFPYRKLISKYKKQNYTYTQVIYTSDYLYIAQVHKDIIQFYF